MLNLFVLNETFTNGLNYNMVNLIYLASILCGIAIIISKNPIVSVLFLIGLFLNIAGYLMMLGLNFIGLSYLLVYVGAVSILFLFILMLINVRTSELTSDSSNSIPLAIIIGIFFNMTLYYMLPSNVVYILDKFGAIGEPGNLVNNNNITYPFNKSVNLFYNNDLSFVTSQVWDGALAETSHITSIGLVIYTSYPIWLILTSLILLLAMVGAIVITIKQSRISKKFITSTFVFFFFLAVSIKAPLIFFYLVHVELSIWVLWSQEYVVVLDLLLLNVLKEKPIIDL